jgi:hypothetical protein
VSEIVHYVKDMHSSCGIQLDSIDRIIEDDCFSMDLDECTCKFCLTEIIKELEKRIEKV